jgi:hypothetical protein
MFALAVCAAVFVRKIEGPLSTLKRKSRAAGIFPGMQLGEQKSVWMRSLDNDG